MEWVKFKDFDDENYWFAKDPKIDNYHLAGYYTGDYMLLSGIYIIYVFIYFLKMNLLTLIYYFSMAEE